MVKRIISYCLTFFVMLLALVIALAGVVRYTILDQKYVLSVLEENNYYESTEKRINEAFENYILQSGLEPSILNGLVTLDEVKLDVQNVISAIYTNSKYEIHSENIKNELNSRINVVLEENHKKPNAEEKQAIEKFVTSIVDAYETEIAYFSDMIQEVGKAFYKMINFVELAIVGVAIAEVILIVILGEINRKETTSYVGVALMAAGILLFAPQLVVISQLNIQEIFMFNNDLSWIIRQMVQDLIKNINFVAIVTVILGFFISIIKIYRNRKREV